MRVDLARRNPREQGTCKASWGGLVQQRSDPVGIPSPGTTLMPGPELGTNWVLLPTPYVPMPQGSLVADRGPERLPPSPQSCGARGICWGHVPSGLCAEG